MKESSDKEMILDLFLITHDKAPEILRDISSVLGSKVYADNQHINCVILRDLASHIEKMVDQSR